MSSLTVCILRPQPSCKYPSHVGLLLFLASSKSPWLPSFTLQVNFLLYLSLLGKSHGLNVPLLEFLSSKSSLSYLQLLVFLAPLLPAYLARSLWVGDWVVLKVPLHNLKAGTLSLKFDYFLGLNEGLIFLFFLASLYCCLPLFVGHVLRPWAFDSQGNHM